MKRLAVVFVMILIGAVLSNVRAATVFSVASGSWSNPATWSGGSVPRESDDVVIHGGDVVTVDFQGGGFACWTLQVGDASPVPNGGIVLISDSRADLFVDNDVTLGIATGGAGVISMSDGTFSFGGTLSKNNGGLIATGGVVRYIGDGQTVLSGTYNNLLFIGGAKVAGGPITVNGFLQIGEGISSADFDAGSFAHHIKGDISLVTGSMDPGAGTFVLDGDSPQTLSTSLVFHNLVCGGPGAKRLFPFGSISVTGDLTINAGSTFNGGDGTCTVEGDWTNNGTFLAGVGTVVLDGASAQKITNPGGSFHNLRLRGAGTKQAFADVVVEGRFTLESGTTYHAQPAIDTHLRGEVNVDGTLDLGTTTLWIEGMGTQDIPGNTFGTLRLAHNTKTATGVLTVNGNLVVESDATFDPASFVHHLKGNLNNDGTVVPGTGDIIFDGAGHQRILGAGMTTSNMIGFVNSLTSAEVSFTVNDELYIDGTASFDAGSNTITVKGNWNNGGTFISGGSTIVLSSPSSQSIIRSPEFHNLVLSGAGVKTANSPITVDSAFVINAAATFSSGAVTHHINGDWTKNGIFLANGGTIAFSGTHPQVITGAIRFNNVTVENDSGVRLSSALGDTIQGALAFTNGRLSLGATDLTLEHTATVTGAAAGKCIVTSGTGRVRRQIQGGAGAGSFTFPIAPNKTSYNPVAIGLHPDPSEPTETFTARVEEFTNASIGFSVIDTAYCTWRIWTIGEETIGGNRVNLAFQWDPDEQGSHIGVNLANPVQLMAYLYVNGTGHYEPVDDAIGPPPLNNPVVAATLGYTTLSFGSYILGNVTALPIQLASFTGVVVPHIGVRLDWRTLSEINNFGFFPQRKRTTDTSWVDLSGSFVPGHGTTNEPHDYSLTDSTVLGGEWMYRLRQVDLNGTSHFSGSITVNVLTDVREESLLPTVFALRQNYPNPFNPATTIEFDLPVTDNISLKVYNLIGQEVATMVNERRAAGRYAEVFNASGLASGVYLYRLRTSSHDVVRKMMIVR